MTRTELESFLAVVQAGSRRSQKPVHHPAGAQPPHSISGAGIGLSAAPAQPRRSENDADAPGGAVCITGHKVDGDLERSTGNTGPTQQKELYHRLQ